MGSIRKVKRIRSAFTTDQINYLEKEFRESPYINNFRRKEIAISLKISERAIKVWFQNRRMKLKKDTSSKNHDEDMICFGPIANTNNQLNNDRVKRSVNDLIECSSSFLTNKNYANDCQVIEDDTQFINNTKQIESKSTKTDDYVESPYFKKQMPISNTQTTFTVLKSGVPPNNFEATAEFSIDLCKKYRSDDKGIKIKDKKINIEKVSKTTDNKTTDIKTIYNQVPNAPTALTAQGKMDTSPEKKPVKNVTPNSEYIPVMPNFYPQPYVHPGVMWNPINVMPLMSTGTALTVPNAYNNISTNSNTIPRTNCTCDCHIKSYPIPMAFQQSHVSPQYVMTAIPLQNPSTKF